MMRKIDQIKWVAKALFDRNKVSGSSGNISFKDGDYIYVSNSGSCFGLLNENSFSKFDLVGNLLSGKPSKEYPMHLKLYNNASVNCVIHTHSYYSTLISCVDKIEEKTDILYSYTPYLRMQTNGNIGVVDYAEPGTEQLFQNFYDKYDEKTKVYLLKNHGVFVSGEDILKTFYLLEEFEETARIVNNIENHIYNKIG